MIDPVVTKLWIEAITEVCSRYDIHILTNEKYNELLKIKQASKQETPSYWEDRYNKLYQRCRGLEETIVTLRGQLAAINKILYPSE